ncbi:MAG: ComF family protein [Candidatus Hydrothermae bacterium]|nr:ComF family protein [Candidatus Hydrothermae bacterium]
MEIRDLIEKFKYQRQRAVVKFFKNYIVNLLDENYDFIIPVPLHPLKEKERGFNQSLLIAELIKEELQVPIVTEGIIRTKYTKTQTKLSRKEREENVKNAFNIKSVKRFIGKKLLIVDDVYTTGSTVRSLAKCFPKEVSRIDVLTLAIARL